MRQDEAARLVEVEAEVLLCARGRGGVGGTGGPGGDGRSVGGGGGKEANPSNEAVNN